jgi:hypothetical protein
MLELASVSTVCASLEINVPAWSQISNTTGWTLFGGRELGSGATGKYFEVGSSASNVDGQAMMKARDKTQPVLFLVAVSFIECPLFLRERNYSPSVAALSALSRLIL